jgi:hypothetical protein
MSNISTYFSCSEQSVSNHWGKWKYWAQLANI